MAVDIFIAVGGFLIQCGLALLGLKLTHWKHKFLFSVLVIFGAALMAIAVKRSLDSQKRIETLLGAIGSRGFMEFNMPPKLLPGFSTIATDRVIAMELGHTNRGNADVRSAFSFSGLMVSEGIYSAGTDRFMRFKFGEEMALRANKTVRGQYGPGRGVVGTRYIPPLTSKQVDAILNGDIRIFAFGWTTWVEATGEQVIETCLWLQRPQSAQLITERMRWNRCAE
ncbi:MAG: hypothetical protein A3H28_02075 [Acidobacteria bacterium RIFCSPLOWO2_02_FULL_61_28]|nr:MAG: hypothetical protein A3H28_02075 [Acidobacteria bacterium RIFCSPLOWO2_02_FULL_61_28]